MERLPFWLVARLHSINTTVSLDTTHFIVCVRIILPVLSFIISLQSCSLHVRKLKIPFLKPILANSNCIDMLLRGGALN